MLPSPRLASECFSTPRVSLLPAQPRQWLASAEAVCVQGTELPALYLPLLFANNGLGLVLDLLSLLLGSFEGLLSTPVVVRQESVSLRQLRALVDKMATKQEVVLRLDGEGVAHESRRVDNEGAGHATGDTVWELVLTWRRPPMRGGQLPTDQGSFGYPSRQRREYQSWRQVPRSLRHKKRLAMFVFPSGEFIRDSLRHQLHCVVPRPA